MTEISKIEGIRELTSEEIAAVAGGDLQTSGPLSCFISQIRSIICRVERLISCFGGGGQTPSDIRMKHDISLVGRLDNGLGFYRFSYNGSDKAYVGVMAQEVEEVVPKAVVHGRDGYLRVKYDMLGIQMETWEEWVASGQKIPTTRH